MGECSVTQFHIVGLDPSMTGFGVAVVRPGAEFTPLLQSVSSAPVRVADGEDPFVAQLNRLRSLVSRARRIALTGYQEGDALVVLMEGPAYGSMQQKQQHQDTRAGLRWLTAHTFETKARPQVDGTPGAFIIVPPTSLKRYVTKKGNSNKLAMMAAAVGRAFPEINFHDDDNQVDAYGMAAMACRALGYPVEPSPQRVDPGALVGVNWPRFIEKNRSTI